MNKKEFKLMIKEGESYNLEFKESYSDSISREICAFVNANGGKILVGVSDKGEIKGIKITNKLKSQIYDLTRNFDPKLDISLEEIDNVLIIDVSEGINKPYSVRGKFYLRNGSNSQQLTRGEIREFFISEGLIHFDEKANPGFNLKKDFSESAYNAFLQMSGISRLTKRKSVLENLALLKNNKLKNAGVLLFCRKITPFLAHATVTCITFQGKERVKILDKKEFGSDFYSNFLNALTYLKEKLNTEYIIRTAGPREEKLEIPEEALKEALLNAIGHRDYFTTTSTFVEIYSDRIEITNPGGLVKGLKKEDLGKKSLPRNNLLFGLLQRMNLVEKAGTGIRRMQEAMKNYRLRKPEILASDDWFTIVFNRPKESYEERIYGKVREKTREKTREKITILIKENPQITIRELSEKTGISEKGIEWNLKRLKDKKILKRIGPDKGGYWKVLK